MRAWIEGRGRGPVELLPGKTGQFDVVVVDAIVYSRHQTGRFPSEADLVRILL